MRHQVDLSDDDVDRLWGPVSDPCGIEPTPSAADGLDTEVTL